jgi:perosamine synthetase
MVRTNVDKNCLTMNATLKEVMTRTNDIAGDIIFIVDDAGVLKGVVTDGDVRRAILNGTALTARAPEFMNTAFTSARENTDHTAQLALLSERIRFIPILDDAGRPVGLLSWADLWRLPLAKPNLGGNELKYVSDCITSGWISSQGPYVERFEKAFADYMGGGYARTVSSGTTALHVALAALGIGPGDEVIVPNLTFGATANVVVHCGATPVFADVDPLTLGLSAKTIAPALSPKTKGIIPVHLYGHPCDMGPIMELAAARNIWVIEDCAESLGALYQGRKAGLSGHMGCFSFFANKVITTGEGGMVITKDAALIEKVSILRDHGMTKDRRYWHIYPGFNYRMTNLQAAVGLAQLEQIDKFLGNRLKIASRYTQQLGVIQGLELPGEAPWAKNIYWLYSIAVDPQRFGLTRDQLRDHLTIKGIETRNVFFPLRGQPAYAGGRAVDCPVSDDYAARGLSLPTANDLTLDEVDRVCDAIHNASANRRLLNIVSN